MQQPCTSLLEDIKNLTDDFNVIRKSYETKMQEKFKAVMKQVFMEIPTLKTIAWTQYSPFFNDGEECIFSVNEPIFCFGKEFDDFDDISVYEGCDKDEDGAYAACMYTLQDEKKLLPSELKILDLIDSLIETNDDMMKDMFGNHVIVKVSSTEIVVDDYNHD